MADNIKGTPLEDLAKKIYGKTDLTQYELEFIVKADMEFIFSQMTVSASETRQVRQYESNNYFISLQSDLGGLRDLIKNAYAEAPEAEKITRYLEAKRTVVKMISEKYAITEDLLRKLIEVQKLGDGVKT